MILRKTFILLVATFCFFPKLAFAQNKDKNANDDFHNYHQLYPLFDKLYNLEHNRSGKVNIVHIGDSHIQADMLTNSIRQVLQSRFGNGGYGFCFPYSLAKTNGTGYIKFTSNIEWNSRRNIYPVTDISVGLSGIGLYTNEKEFDLELEVDPLYAFNRIKVLSTLPEANFTVSFSEEKVVSPPVDKENLHKSEVKRHTVQSGETLYRIAINNNISVDQLKELNHLESNTIKKGMVLVISESIEKEIPKDIPSSFHEDSIRTNKAHLRSGKYYVETIDSTSNTVAYIMPRKQQQDYHLSGIIIENNNPGIIYHTIGVNGAKVSDYNKYPLFFKQLPILHPDLVIVSLGTNESFGKWATPYYTDQLNLLIQNIRHENPSTIILVTTPPPSLFRRRTPNKFIAGYRDAVVQSKEYVVWDLLSKLGGITAPLGKKLSEMMARDKVHYTKEGYETQGLLFTSDFLKAYEQYIKNREK